ncbi:aldehyde dehydrogenase family protein [Aestuariicella sp. G3-2]|uniref:aldehyde dehydrogenase family protein n=1 Tax=Pseudomaricurvus albidus TaxID=2842452 RepID=UPI001C0CF24A|nr:aldehyde dehydrogenase family protein [Aestuariicella albida]
MSDFKMLIGGNLVAAEQTFEVINPADESVAGYAPEASDANLDAAVSCAKQAFLTWRYSSNEERGKVLKAIAKVIKDNAVELSELLSLEQGKSQSQAQREVQQMAGDGAAARAAITLEPEVLQDDEQFRVELHHRPLGVVAAIVPWNFPLGIAIGKLATAIMTGCTVVLKPSPFTPLTTLKLGELIKDVVPKGVINIISGSDSLGPKLSGHPDIAKISFTGSTETGKRVMQGAAADLKRVTLELGGNDAAIVLQDIDLQKMAYPLFLGAFINSGQTCVAIKRIYAHEAIYDDLVNALAFIASQVKVGPASDPESQLGPVQNRMQYDKVMSVLAEVKANAEKGEGRIVAGGETHTGKGFFLKPTIVADVKEGCRLVDEETFGPILPIIRFSDVEEVIQRANSTSYGLGGSVWSSDVTKAAEIASRLESGSAWVNQHPNLTPFVPFAGAKHSGMGVESHQMGLKEYCQVQVVNIAKSA